MAKIFSRQQTEGQNFFGHAKGEPKKFPWEIWPRSIGKKIIACLGWKVSFFEHNMNFGEYHNNNEFHVLFGEYLIEQIIYMSSHLLFFLHCES